MALVPSTPLVVQNGKVFDPIVPWLRPMGATNAEFLQQIRPVVLLEPITDPYVETFLAAAVAAEAFAMRLGGVDGYNVRPLWLDAFISPNGAFQLQVLLQTPLPAVTPVLTGSAAVSFVNMADASIRTPTLGAVGNFPTGTIPGQLVRQHFVASAALQTPVRIPLDGIVAGPDTFLWLHTNAPNVATRVNMAVELERI